QNELKRTANAMAGTPSQRGGMPVRLSEVDEIAKNAGRLGSQWRNQGGQIATDMLPTLGRGALRGAGMALTGMGGAMTAGFDPVSPAVAEAPGGDFMGLLDRQHSVLGGPVPSSEEIGTMMDEFSAPPSPAPSPEVYHAIVPRATGMQMTSLASPGRSRTSN